VAEPVSVLPEDDATPVVDERVLRDQEGAAEVSPHPVVRTRFRDIDRTDRESVTLRTALQAVADESVLLDDRVVADLIDQAVVIVARNIIILELKASIIRVGPESYAVIVVYPVVLDDRVLYVPELPAAGAAAVGRMRLPVVGVVTGDLVVLQHQI